MPEILAESGVPRRHRAARAAWGKRGWLGSQGSRATRWQWVGPAGVVSGNSPPLVVPPPVSRLTLADHFGAFLLSPELC